MLSNFRIGTRLLAGFGVVVLFLLVMGIVSLRNISEQRTLLAEFHEHPFTVSNSMRRAELNILMMHRGMKDVVLYGDDPRELENAVRKIDESEAIVYQELALVRERFLGDQAKVDEIKTMMDQWKGVRAKTIALVRAHRTAEAIAWHKAYARDTVDRIVEDAKEVVKFAYARANQFIEESTQTQKNAYLTGVLLTIVAVLTAIGTAVAITASIIRPINQAADAAQRLATGDLSVEVESAGRDEAGQMLRATRSMTESLRRMGETANRIAQGDLSVDVVPRSEHDVLGLAMQGMVASLRLTASLADRIAAGDLTVEIAPKSDKDQLGASLATMTRNLRELNRDIGECVGVLSTSAGEILTTVSEFASTSSETASAISETNATVQEVRQTTDLASQKSKQVYESSQNAVAVARTGKRSVEDAIEGMRSIDDRMSFIAERIVNLSEQSQAIGEIIATVGDLAEQSNLLAVNAAIEAAKAGEHGKGFAVVAQEVKNLATQSKQATAQVRNILGYIQKATTAAVLATEQGSKAVESGVRQSGEAGEAIRLLAQSIEEASNSTLQIVTSTQEQAVGMDQIAIAIQSINQAGSQNVEGSRQIETAARNLYDLNQKLQQLVSRFKVA
ncbi:HAMP domain-containing methyl-accepting chemotaxis protein [Geomesophilobacter sediminis]|uniref:HAMP domain-containing protein n=1 Tax=Geomesophilobacter sediminis TaxID=2798584 RepID=A0A8J7M0I1_9BACT|nr:methyl-accepting chemotaxis protein [Geomesophilobacter sediminis]MBJ6725307.1 HAMP domain-containing protein [Geomesophilobacter sediminis]